MPRNSLTILGCGTSTGVPVMTCSCAVCRSRHPRNKRLRASAWFQVNGKSLLIDTSTDLRQQALKHKIKRIDAVLYTHPHADHTHGIDELRAFNFSQKQVIPAYGNEWTCAELPDKFPYIFKPTGPVEGGGLPQIDLKQFDSNAPILNIAGVKIIPIPLHHGSKESTGYRIGSVAYLTDCNGISAPSLDRLQGLSVLILDCLRFKPHGTHFHLQRALEVIERLKPKKTYLTHLSHDFDYLKWDSPKQLDSLQQPSIKKLPKNIRLAYDGLTVHF